MYYFTKKDSRRYLTGRTIIVLGITVFFLGVTFMCAFAAEKVTVSWWKAPQLEDPKEEWRPILEKFEQENPNIKVEHVVTTWEGWLEKHLPAYIAGTPPDVAYISSDFFYTVAHGEFLQPLDEMDPAYVSQMKDTINDRSLSAITVGGQVLEVPITLASLFLIYNKDLFRKAGLDPNKAPETWEDVVEYGQRIVSTGTAKYAIVWPTLPPRIASLWWTGWQYSAGVDTLTEDLLHTNINQPEAVEALTFMRDLDTKYQLTPPPHAYTVSEVTNFFFNQDAAMILFEEPTVAVAKKYLPEADIGVGFWPVSQKLFAQGKRFNRGWNEGNCVARASKHREEAFQLAKYLGSQFAAKWWAEQSFHPSPRTDISLGEDDPLLKKVIDMAPYIKFDPPSIYVPRLQFMMGDTITSVLSGEKLPREALDELAKEIESFLTGD